MIPILYKSAEVDFTTNGLGLLNDIYSVDIQEQRNGLLTLTASYPTNAKHYKEIETGRIIYAKPNPLDDAQAFRIVKTELDISGYNLNIEADHITYDLTHNLVKEVHLQGDGQNAMTHLQNATVTPHLFRFVSDLQHLGDSRLQYVNPMEAIAGTEGSILQIWGGELHRDNRTVSMLSRRGRDNFTTFRLGKNINGLKYTVDMSNVTTRIVPTVTKSDATDNDKAYFVVGDTVDSKNLNKYPNVYIQHVDMGEKVTINEGETDEQIKAKIDKQAKNWFTQSANTGIDLPQVTVEIDVTSLQDSADYQEKFRNLESVGLTDTVSVYVPEFNVNVTAIVNELHYDPVAERVTSLVVGTSKKSFADNNSNALAELQNSITQIRQDATTAIVSSNGKNTNYYGTEEPAHPVEGDLWFKSVGDETYLMIFKDGRWQEWVSTKTQDIINKQVDDALASAKEYTDELNDRQASEAAVFQSEANAALSSAAAERKVFSNNAASMATSAATHADSMANSAAAYGKAQAASALSSANSALTTAKSDLTTAINQEISDRNQAVSVVNSQAQEYVTQAKSDINDTINALSVGGRNLLLDTGRSISGVGLNRPNLDFMNPQVGTYYLAGGKKVSDLYKQYGPSGYITLSFDWVASGDTISGSFNAMWNQSPWGGLRIIGPIEPSITNKSGHYVSTVQLNFSGYSTGIATGVMFKQDNLQGNITISNIKLEAGNKATDWTPAPEDVVLDYTTKDNKIKETITQYQETNDGNVSKAQTDATTALGLVETKVSQTVYDQKTGELSSNINTATQTANETKNELANVSKTVDSQSAQINTISNTVDGTTQTISDIKTEQGKQSGSIATLKSRADGFDATVTKVNNLSVGGRNLFLGTKDYSGNSNWSINGNLIEDVYQGLDAIQTAGAWGGPRYKNSALENQGVIQSVNDTFVMSAWVRNTGTTAIRIFFYGDFVPTSNKNIAVLPANSGWVRINTEPFYFSKTSGLTGWIRFEPTTDATDGYVQQVGLKLEKGSIATDWSPAPEDVSSATAKAQLTADKANLDLSKYKTDADGRISKAQSDITATSEEVKTKVSQSDYNAKTDDLTTKYGQVKATADAVTTDVSNYKKSNDGKVSANEASIKTLSGQITSKVSQTDYDKETKDLEGKYSETKQTVDSISNTVTELQAKANAQGQVNQLMNTEFNPDTENWSLTANTGVKAPYKSFAIYGSNGIGFDTTNAPANTFAYLHQTVILPSTRLATDVMSLSWRVNTRRMDNYCHIWLYWQDENGNNVADRTMGNWNDSTLNEYNVLKWENISIPIEARQVMISFEAREGTSAYIFQPMLTFEKVVGDYVSGNYNNNARVAALEVDLNGITGLVNDPKKGLSATAALAANGLSVATTAKNAATTAIQTANGTQTTVTNVQKDVKDLQSTTTQMAGQVTTEIEDRKNGDKSVRTDMANLIDQRVKNVKSGYESAISQSADTIMASVSQPNQLMNTEFSPDLDGWTITNTGGTSRPYRSYIDKAIGSTSIGFNTVGDAASTYGSTVAQEISVSPGSNGIPVSMRWDVRTVRNDYYTNLWLTFKDSTGAQLGRINKQWSYTTADNRWHEIKWENVAVPDDTRSIKVSFEARENTTQYLARPMLVFGSTIGTYTAGSYSGMNTSTVLELFKDNWALGIADNAGRLISGINGDKSGTVIQGKKLVINSDTTINGKAFIDGSVIKNASIGQAQIGKAAVGSAQIINVDVSKISGNIANFITANINTLNAKVLYGDTGHLGTTDTGRVINKQDNHLQLASKGMYNSANDRAQVELLSHTNDIDANMRGSFNYYSDVRKGHGLGIRLVQNQILAIDEDGGSKNLYLSPYQGGQVRIVSRDLNSYYDIAAANFRVSSQRKFKSDIKPLDDGALDIVNKTNIKSYTKNGVSEIGVIADEAPNELLSDDGKFINIYDYTSVLYKAVQELSAQVKEFQNERPNN